ncbi:hypothetical protein BH24CHL9_BH24CHL9_04910 [soil metagenome]
MRTTTRFLTRRTFLRVSAATAGGAALAGLAPRAMLGQEAAVLQVTSPDPAPDSAASVLVGDVLDFRLRGDFAWNGGWVTFRLHEGRIDGEPVWFIRTDASERSFAEQEGLVFVPLLAASLADPVGTGLIYLFDAGASGQLPVLSTVPGHDDFTPLYRVAHVSFSGEPALLESIADIEAAVAAGEAEVEETPVVVNYPAVRWPGGELPVDTVVELPLAGGPLLAPPDTEAMTVTFKLHQCYPESRYIITDTSAVPMAPMMGIPGSPATAGLTAAGAVSTITVFGNGFAGPGAMGFQPGIFREKAGDPAWSPLWDHLTAVWKEGSEARLLTSQAEVDAAVAAGHLEIFVGTPDTGGQGFVVNCPSPIVAHNDFELSG